jgi:hypothetical protein
LRELRPTDESFYLPAPALTAPTILRLWDNERAGSVIVLHCVLHGANIDRAEDF